MADALRPLEDLARQARHAAGAIALAPPGLRTDALVACAEAVERAAEPILVANAADMARADRAGTSAALLDRLRLDPGRVASMAAGLRRVAGQPDPVGRVVDGWTLPNGLRVRRVRVPLGTIGVIYEARPNVTADAAALALRSGNAILLRGSSLAEASNVAVAEAIGDGLRAVGLPQALVSLVRDTSRAGAVAFLQLQGLLDCVVPRGGPSLLATVASSATVPVVLDGAGNCHVYVDAGADLEMALEIVANAKCSRPGVCNAAETLLVHEAVADAFLPRLPARLPGVELRADPRAAALLPGAAAATEADFATEFLDLVLAVGVVGDLEEAVAHIARYGTGHSEAIVTEDRRAAERFVAAVDAAAVLVNVSTRFVDGGELGFGAEIGISTQKLHVRGPMGAEALTTVKLVVEGDGQVRV